jgi:glutamine amidotransferase
MSSHLPAEVNFSLEELQRHAGRARPHRDGWGIAYYDGRDTRLIKESRPADRSPCLRFLEQQHVSSNIAIAHIRHATRGRVRRCNTQPFQRELGGRMHVFAHNGDTPGVFRDERFATGRFRPVGETDSEYAFCDLLRRLAPTYDSQHSPSLRNRLETFAHFAADLATLGPANLLYSDGRTLFAHSHQRRTWPSEPYRPPGLYALIRRCTSEPTLLHAPGVRICGTSQPQRAALLASVPLSAEAWRPLSEGAVLALEDGQLIAELRVDVPPCFAHGA